MNRFKDLRYWLNLLLFVLGTAALGTLYILLRLSYQGAQNYAHPTRFQRAERDTPELHGIHYQDVTLTTSDGIRLAAWYTPPQNGNLLLLAHGYGGARSAEKHAMFARHGFGVVSWDARAHGESGGDLVTWGYYERRDVAAALAFALAQEGVENVGAYGESMGAATVLLAAAEEPKIQAVATDSAFAAIGDLVETISPYPIFRPLLTYFIERETGLKIEDLRPVDAIGQISPSPVFIIQGLADETVPPGSAQRLYEAAGEPRYLWTAEGVGHVGMSTACPDEYERRVVAFFERYLTGNR